MMKQSEESITRMTSYRFPHHDNRSFAAALDASLPSLSFRVVVECFAGMTGNDYVTRDDESIPLMMFSGRQLIFQSLLPGFCLTSDCLQQATANR